MAGNIQNVSFMSPQAMIAPDQAVEQQQVQRQSDLAAALRQMSMDPIDAGKGNIAWTQGMAKIAQAIAGRIVQNRADKQQKSLNQVMSQRMGSMFGQQGGGGPASGGGGQAPPPASIAPPTMNVPDAPSAAPSGVPQAPSPTMPQPGQADQLAPMPPQQAPQQAPQQQARGPWSLSGNPQQDMAGYMLNPEEYGKAVIGNMGKGAAPTDVEILQQHLQQAVSSGNMGAAQAIMAQLNKVNYIAPVNGRPGSTLRDANDPTKIIGYDAPMLEGGIPQYDQNGQFTGYKAAEGAAAIQGTISAAKTGGEEGARAPYRFQQTYNPQTRQMENTPVSEMVGGASGGGNGATGPVRSLYAGRGNQGGGHFAAGPALGQSAAADAYGKFSGGAFGDIQAGAASAPQALASIREMQHLTSTGQVSTGPAAAKLQQWGQEHGIDFLTRPGNFVFNKDASRYIAQTAATLGLNGSDARLGLIATATPGQYMPNAALNKVLPTVAGLEMAKMAQASAAAQYGRSNPDDVGGFQTFWRRNYDPLTFTAMSNGADNFKNKYLPSLKGPERAVVIGKIKALQNAGVDFASFAQ